jgi:PGF-pre-PGF domain-containing protein
VTLGDQALTCPNTETVNGIPVVSFLSTTAGQGSISGGLGGTVVQQMPNGNSMQAHFSSDSVAGNASVFIIPQSSSTIIPTKPVPTDKTLVSQYLAEVEIWKGLIQVHKTSQPVTIKMTYSSDELRLAGVNESSLKIYHWNETSLRWEVLTNNVVDTINKTVSATTANFSFFAIFGDKSQDKLMKSANDDKVYVITYNNYKRHIPNEQIFLAYGYNWDQIQTIAKTQLDAYPVSNLIKLADDPKVYLINGNTKSWVPDEQTFNNLKLDWNAISEINQIEFDSYPTKGSAIPTSSTNYVFKSLLKVGSSGEEVRQLQLKLKSLGFYKYPSITGLFGNATKQAVIDFQKANHISPVGYVGPATRAVLNSK